MSHFDYIVVSLSARQHVSHHNKGGDVSPTVDQDDSFPPNFNKDCELILHKNYRHFYAEIINFIWKRSEFSVEFLTVVAPPRTTRIIELD
jgi:hypothetical protein